MLPFEIAVDTNFLTNHQAVLPGFRPQSFAVESSILNCFTPSCHQSLDIVLRYNKKYELKSFRRA